MKVEFNLSNKVFIDDQMEEGQYGKYFYTEENVKEFIRLLKEEDEDTLQDVISLVELEISNKYGLDDLLGKLKRLLKAHFDEKIKLSGEKLK